MDSRNIFWGLVIKPGKRYETEVQEPFRVTKACIEPSSTKDGKVTSVMVECDNSEEFIIANLNMKTFNETLDISFNDGEKICFKVEGPGTVHLTGNLLEEKEKKKESEAETVVQPGEKSKKESNGGKAKKAKTSIEEEEDSNEDNDDDDDEEGSDSDEVEDSTKDGADTTAATEGSDDDDEDDDSEEEEEEEEEEKKPAKKVSESPKKESAVNGAMTPKGDKKPKTEKTPKQADVKSESKTPKQDAKNQNEGALAKTPKQETKTPKEESKAPKQETKTPKQETKTPKEESKTPKQETKTPKEDSKTPRPESKTPKVDKAGQIPKRTIKGGIQVEDVKEGSGPECKPGNMIGMYYEGRLKSNNKRFDGLKEGKPFKFKLGAGQVIKGWDIGVLGMKVGGKRKLTIPAKFAYGASGAPPDIPPNSALVFDIECKFVK